MYDELIIGMTGIITKYNLSRMTLMPPELSDFPELSGKTYYLYKFGNNVECPWVKYWPDSHRIFIYIPSLLYFGLNNMEDITELGPINLADRIADYITKELYIVNLDSPCKWELIKPKIIGSEWEDYDCEKGLANILALKNTAFSGYQLVRNDDERLIWKNDEREVRVRGEIVDVEDKPFFRLGIFVTITLEDVFETFDRQYFYDSFEKILIGAFLSNYLKNENWYRESNDKDNIFQEIIENYSGRNMLAILEYAKYQAVIFGIDLNYLLEKIYVDKFIKTAIIPVVEGNTFQPVSLVIYEDLTGFCQNSFVDL